MANMNLALSAYTAIPNCQPYFLHILNRQLSCPSKRPSMIFMLQRLPNMQLRLLSMHCMPAQILHLAYLELLLLIVSSPLRTLTTRTKGHASRMFLMTKIWIMRNGKMFK